MTDPITPNPYDCQNPVIDHRLFAGRHSELREIRYYLEQARVTRPTNLAFIGARGSGKTSLLYMASHYAVEAGLAVIEVRFDESHAQSQVAFFFHLFDSIVNTVFRMKQPGAEDFCFGGTGGDGYRAYIDAAYAHQRVDPEKLGFLFPFIYAAAMERGRSDFVLPQTQIGEDLRRISREVGRPIVLLLDECNVVVSKRDILQSLRNIFQDQPGYMIVMAGTESLFPLIDDVFSPVGRGFKQINVGTYFSARDTYECMLAPLVASKLDPAPIKAFKPTQGGNEDSQVPRLPQEASPPDLEDLHRFTSGSPLEIRRACHFMYRDMQMRRGKIMRMSSSVLESVLQDLASSSDRRELLDRLKRLGNTDLDVVSVLSCFGRELSFRAILDLIALRRVLLGNQPTSEDELCSVLLGLERQELVKFDKNLQVVRWIAGELESILAKYVARAAQLPAGRFPKQDESGSQLFGLLTQSKLMEKFARVDDTFEARRWSPWFRLVDDHLRVNRLFGSEVVDLGMFGRFLTLYVSVIDSQSESGVTYGCSWEGQVLEPHRDGAIANVLLLQSEVDNVNSTLADATERFQIHLEVRWHEPAPALFTSITRAREVCRQPINRSSIPWMNHAHNEICNEFLRMGPTAELAAGVAELIADPESNSGDFDVAAHFPNIGFVALACGLPVTRGFFRRANEIRRHGNETDAIHLYNEALSCLICDIPDLDGAACALSKLSLREDLLAASDRGGYRALIRVTKQGANDLAFVLWKPQDRSENVGLAQDKNDTSNGRTLGGFVNEALDAIRSVQGSTSDVRVLRLPLSRRL
jgi:hypothetical protein